MDTLPLVNNAPQEWTMNNTHLVVNNVALGASVQNLFMLSVIFHPSGALQKELSLCISMKVVDIFTLEVLTLVPSHFDIYKSRYAQNIPPMLVLSGQQLTSTSSPIFSTMHIDSFYIICTLNLLI